jgi:hypothetical protein
MPEAGRRPLTRPRLSETDHECKLTPVFPTLAVKQNAPNKRQRVIRGTTSDFMATLHFSEAAYSSQVHAYSARLQPLQVWVSSLKR